MQHLNNNECECLTYFQSDPVWHKLLSGFWEKYASFGRFTGSVRVANPSAHEIDVLEGFFGQNFHGQKSITISAERFSKALCASRYADVSPEQLLQLYFGSVPISKKEQKENEEKKQQAIVAEFSQYCENTAAQSLILSLLELQKGSIKKDLREWKRLLFLSADIIHSLPYRTSATEYLPVFAARLTRNPHAFDKEAYRVIFSIRSFFSILNKETFRCRHPSNFHPTSVRKVFLHVEFYSTMSQTMYSYIMQLVYEKMAPATEDFKVLQQSMTSFKFR